jgi:Predicted acyl-CoA transferases/carnitine dehydratase
MKSFGVLEGVKVAHATSSLAGPFAAGLFADWGADCIWLENPSTIDLLRWRKNMIEQDRRNQRSMLLDIPSPIGRKIFFELIKDVHIFIETSKGGQWAKWGLTDEVLWEQNPALVIVHGSGYGQDGIPEYVSRPSYDPVAQAFSGFMAMQGDDHSGPIMASPQPGDAFMALMIAASALAALHRAQKTGKGESIDVAQYECLVRIQQGMPADYFNSGEQFPRQGSKAKWIAGFGAYTCKDGEKVFLLCAGGGVMKRAIPEFGLEYGSELFPAGLDQVFTGTPGAPVFDAAIEKYCMARTAKEVDERLNSVGIPCSLINEFRHLLDNPQYVARETITEWETIAGEKFKGINIIPRFKNSPGKILRGAPSSGYDNEAILSELGYSDAHIKEFYEKKVITKTQG